MLLKKKIPLSITQHLHAQSFVFNVRFVHIFSLHCWVNKLVISADCLASVYSKIPHSFAASVEATAKKRTPPASVYPVKYALCSSRKYPYPPPNGGQRKFRGEGGPNFQGVGSGLLNRPLKFFRGSEFMIVVSS